MYRSVYEDIWSEVQDAISETSGATVGDAVQMVKLLNDRELIKEIRGLRTDLKRMELRNREVRRSERNR